jgi:outer membrane protein assembly factor BamB
LVFKEVVMKVSFLALFSCVLSLACAASPVKGRMAEPLLVCGGGRAFLVAPDGHVAWNKSGCGNIHRVWYHAGWVYYANGELRRVDVVSGKDESVYKPAPREGVFGFEILKNGNIVVAENATDHITELQAGTFKPIVRFKGNPANAQGKIPGGVHHHYRMIRKTPAGTYLVCCSSAQVVREYDKTGKLLWEQPTPALAFDCLRRANGNTLVSHLNAVTEYTPDHRIAWQFACGDAPALKLANLCGIWEQNAVADSEAEMIAFLEENGTSYNEVDLDAFTAACEPVYDWIVDSYGADPELRGKLVALVQEYRANNG